MNLKGNGYKYNLFPIYFFIMAVHGENGEKGDDEM